MIQFKYKGQFGPTVIDHHIKAAQMMLKTVYTKQKDVALMLFGFYKIPGNSVVVELLPMILQEAYRSGDRELFVELTKKSKVLIEKQVGKELVAIQMIAQAWSSKMDADDKISDTDLISKARVRVPASASPTRKEIVLINISSAEKKYNRVIEFDLKRSREGMVTDMVRNYNGLNEYRSVLDEVWT